MKNGDMNCMKSLLEEILTETMKKVYKRDFIRSVKLFLNCGVFTLISVVSVKFHKENM